MPVALVTGANRGIGREVARQLAERDYDVILTARDEAKAREAAEEIGARPARSSTWRIRTSIERGGRPVDELDVLVNNAGVVIDGGVAGAEPDFDAIQRHARDELLRRLPAHRRAAAACCARASTRAS